MTKRIFFFILFVFITINSNVAYCNETQNLLKPQLKSEDLDEFTLDELAEFIASEKIYDVFIFGIDPNDSNFKPDDLSDIGLRQVLRVNKKFDNVINAIDELLMLKSESFFDKKQKTTLTHERKKLAAEIIAIRSFYNQTVKKQTKFNSETTIIFPPSYPFKLFTLEFSFTFACLAFGRQALTLLNR
ncbi:MAG: hypothetical protein LBP59_17440 [Planctomycetaceae bacterium]|nr:hypothetical protein [Planctomycetaceae bacterium]